MFMINEFAKNDAFFRKFALYICKDEFLADDLTQEMYLKVYDKTNIKDIKSYGIITIKNLFLTQTKKNKNENIDDFNFKIDESFELDDTEIELINKLKWWEKEIVEWSYDESCRTIAKKLNVNYGFIHQVIKKSKNKWEDLKK